MVEDDSRENQVRIDVSSSDGDSAVALFGSFQSSEPCLAVMAA